MVFKIIEEHKFHKRIVGLTCNPQTKELYVGLIEEREYQPKSSEIWSLNANLSQNRLLFNDSLSLKAMKGCINNKEWVTIAILFSNKGWFSKAIIMDPKTGPKVLLTPEKSEKTYYGRITQVSFNKDQNPCIVLDGSKPKVICNDRITELSEYIEFPDKKRAYVYASLQEFLNVKPDLPDFLIGEGCYQFRGYINKKRIFSYDYRSMFEKLSPHAMTMDLMCRFHKNTLYTLFVNWGKGLHDLKMLKDFKDYWTLDHTSGPALIMDLNGDGTEELICGGADSKEFGSFIKIFKNMYDEKPILLEKAKIPYLIGLLADDINNDGKIELIAFSDHEIIVYQYDEQ